MRSVASRVGMLALAAWLLTFGAAIAQPQQRFALLIGNQGYNDKVGPLKNPHNDVVIVGKALAEVGFKLLTLRKDASREEMLFAVHELAARMRTTGRGAVSFLYYAGHGVAVGSENVLLPTNAEGTSDAEIGVRGVKLREIIDILKDAAPDAVHFVVLDACRSNMRGQRGSRGFVPVTEQRKGVVVAFSTAAGETATDEGATNAPYAKALADEIVKPGRSDQVVFNEVRKRVVDATGSQTPWTHDGLVGDRVVFKAAAQPEQPTAAAPASEAAQVWSIIQNTDSPAILEQFEKKFSESPFAEFAKARRLELRRQQTELLATEAKNAPPAPPVVAPPATTAMLQPSVPLSPSQDGRCVVEARQLEIDSAGLGRFSVTSSCGAIQAIVVRYDAWSFRYSPPRNAGQIVIALDLFAGAADLIFDVPGVGSTTLTPRLPRMTDVFKVALVWRGRVDLDLHALHFGASIGTRDGHVWSGEPRSLVEARLGRTGFMFRLASGVDDADNVQVFTFFKTSQTPLGSIQFRIDYRTRAEQPRPPHCDGGPLARIEYALLRMESGRLDRPQRGLVNPQPCAAVQSHRYEPLRNLTIVLRQ